MDITPTHDLSNLRGQFLDAFVFLQIFGPRPDAGILYLLGLHGIIAFPLVTGDHLNSICRKELFYYFIGSLKLFALVKERLYKLNRLSAVNK